VLALALFATATPAAAQPDPLCKVAPDADYGYTKDRPIQVGGSPLYGPARQRRYLSALRGPKGETLSFERGGSTPGADPDTILDIYSVTYAGLETPLRLYLDLYHYTEPFAPQGLSCGTRIELGTPPPDPLQAEEQIAALATTVASSRGFRSPPIPLGEDGKAGLVLDPFRLQSRRAPTAAARGQAMPIPNGHTLVVAYPQTCESRAIAPTSLAVVNTQGRDFPAVESFADAKRLAAVVPGPSSPAGTMAATFQGDVTGAGMDVRVTYAEACGSEPATRTWTIAYTDATLVVSPMPSRPAGDTSGVPWIAVQAVIDHLGALQEARPLGGPPQLATAAIEAIKSWRVLPPRANSAPLTRAVVLIVTFVD
jgi:hypothetical protein